MTSWVEMTEKEQLVASHYDFYKVVHGVRPRWMDYDSMTEDQLRQEMEYLSIQAEEQEKLELAAEAHAIEKFEARVAELITMGAQDRATAIRWIRDSENVVYEDDDYVCYVLGLPYGYFDKENV